MTFRNLRAQVLHDQREAARLRGAKTPDDREPAPVVREEEPKRREEGREG